MTEQISILSWQMLKMSTCWHIHANTTAPLVNCIVKYTYDLVHATSYVQQVQLLFVNVIHLLLRDLPQNDAPYLI